MRAILSFFKLLIFGIWSFIAIMLGGLLYNFQWKDGMAWIAKYFWAPIVIPLIGGWAKIESRPIEVWKLLYLLMSERTGHWLRGKN